MHADVQSVEGLSQREGSGSVMIARQLWRAVRLRDHKRFKPEKLVVLILHLLTPCML